MEIENDVLCVVPTNDVGFTETECKELLNEMASDQVITEKVLVAEDSVLLPTDVLDLSHFKKYFNEASQTHLSEVKTISTNNQKKYNSEFINENSQSHFKKYLKENTSHDSGHLNYKFSRASFQTKLKEEPKVVQMLSEQQKEAVKNISVLSKFLLSQMEENKLGYLDTSKKSIKDKWLTSKEKFTNKLNDTKKKIFFSIVKRAQKALNI